MLSQAIRKVKGSVKRVKIISKIKMLLSILKNVVERRYHKIKRLQMCVTEPNG